MNFRWAGRGCGEVGDAWVWVGAAQPGLVELVGVGWLG